jgi:hypothetical protein
VNAASMTWSSGIEGVTRYGFMAVLGVTIASSGAESRWRLAIKLYQYGITIIIL